MKKSVTNIVFYLGCLIVLLLFTAMFFNLRNLEGLNGGDNNRDNNNQNDNNNNQNNNNQNNNNQNNNNQNNNNQNNNNQNNNNQNNNNDNNNNQNNNNDNNNNQNNTKNSNQNSSSSKNTSTCKIGNSKYLIIGDNSVSTYLKAPRSSGFRSDSFYTLQSGQSIDTNLLAHFAIRDTNMLDYVGPDNSKTQVYFIPTSSFNTTTGIASGIFCLASFSGIKYPVRFYAPDKTMSISVSTSSSSYLYQLLFVKDANGIVSTIMSKNSRGAPILHSVCETMDI